jgi:hypothetical protein
MKYCVYSLLLLLAGTAYAQDKQDSIAIRQAALDYIESQHKPNPDQFARSSHPRLVKRTFWKHAPTGKDFLYESTQEQMLLVAESYNKKGDKFPAQPIKDVKILDIFQRTASVKLIANDWIDYMHLIKLNGKWEIVNVVWQFNDSNKHQ